PVAVVLHRLHELAVDADGVVGVLARDREVSLGVPVGVIFFDVERSIALLGQLKRTGNVIGRNQRGLGVGNSLAQLGVLGLVEALRLMPIFFVREKRRGRRRSLTSFKNGIQMAVQLSRTCDQGGNLLFLDDLP